EVGAEGRAAIHPAQALGAVDEVERMHPVDADQEHVADAVCFLVVAAMFSVPLPVAGALPGVCVADVGERQARGQGQGPHTDRYSFHALTVSSLNSPLLRRIARLKA